ncbi:MAG: aminoacyl-tRNA hydrolase [Patescibacteria group bacterium]
MGIVVKKSDEVTKLGALYSFGLERTLLIVGLGNPGKQYLNNRHNYGFTTLERFAQTNGLSWKEDTKMKGHVASGNIAGCKIMLLKPMTFMNESGQAVRAALDYYKLPTSSLHVIYDEADLDLGHIRVGQGGGSAGHNGIKSIDQHIGAGEYTKIRLGIGPKDPPQIDLADFVLQDFPKDQMEVVKKVVQETCAMLGEATATDLTSQTRSVV